MPSFIEARAFLCLLIVRKNLRQLTLYYGFSNGCHYKVAVLIVDIHRNFNETVFLVIV